MLRPVLAPLAAALLAGCTTLTAPAEAPAAAALPTMGAVSAADPRAQAAGEAMLAQGGNATDAAIATMIALTVVEPQSSGIGGGGFLLRGTAAGEIASYDGRETAPAAATPDWFYVNGRLPDFDESVRSGLSVGVPGNIAMAALAHRRHGSLPWARLFEPAIALARGGFAINRRLYRMLEGAPAHAGWSPAARALYFDAAGKPRGVGTLVINKALARSLEAIAARGPEEFYRGAIAREAVATVAAATPRAPAITAEDFAAYAARPRDAVCGSYRRHRICSMGPPSSGGVAVLQILGMVERFDLAALGPQNPVTWHLFVEAQRLAYADRELYMADPDFVQVPTAGLIEPSYIASRSALIDPAKTLGLVAPGVPAGASVAFADGDEAAEHGTSHLAATDGEGTMVSYTSTIEGAFGSGLMTGGFYLNNELTDFSRSPVRDGRPVANRVEGGKRPRSSMSPTLVWDPEGRPLLAIGAAGGPTIPVQTARSIIGVIDFGLSAEAALGLPFIMAARGGLLVEEGSWMEAAIAQFLALGHAKVTAMPPTLKAGAVLRGPQGWTSVRDPRLERDLADMP